MKGIGTIIMVLIGVSVLAACLLCQPYYQTCDYGRESISAQSQIQPYQSYQDACVTQVTHPDIQLEISKVESQGSGCDLCYYWFRVWNRTGNVGTKAYDMRIWLVEKPDQIVRLDGKEIQMLKLHGFITELKPVNYHVVKHEEHFLVQAKCPACLSNWEKHQNFIVEYYDCDGVTRRHFNFNFASKQVEIKQSSYEAIGNCN